MVTLAIGGHKTTSRVAKWLSTGKLKLSRVTSGYGGDILPLSQVHPPRPPAFWKMLNKTALVFGTEGPTYELNKGRQILDFRSLHYIITYCI